MKNYSAMGKPKQRVSQVSSDVSSRNSSISLKKNKKRKMKRKMLLKQRRSIERLYDRIRNSSTTTVDTNYSDKQTPRKRKQAGSIGIPHTKRRLSESVVVITDETPKKCDPPVLHTSTPKTSQRDISEINLSNIVTNNSEEKTLTNQIQDLTKEINRSSYLTIDLTKDTLQTTNSLSIPTVIHLDDTIGSDNGECTVVVIPDDSGAHTSENVDHNSSESTLIESDVTVVKNPSKRLKKNHAQERKMREFANGISKMNASDKGKLLEMITEKIFSGCQVHTGLGGSGTTIKTVQSRAVETAEDTFIKEVILGETPSRNSVGSNIYNPERAIKSKSGLRMVVIDGSNVAMSHGQHKVFSVKGLKICLDYFVRRGHIVKAFVPRFRCKFGKSTEPRLLDELERQGLVVYTPSREVQGRTITPYDDRYIIQCAAEFDGVIVSGDNYRDLLHENPRWRKIIETRLLQFTWVNDMIMFPKDPLGRNGPTLEQMLRHTPS